jgi:hypothetical protein
MTLDIAFDPLGGEPHVHGQRRDEDGSRNREHAFPQGMIGGALEQDGGGDADEHREADAPMHRGNQLPAPALAQVRQADCHDQERFQSFTKCDNERLEHESNPACN